MKKVALYDPFLDTLGGGELHVLSILKVLSSHGYEPTIFWNENLTKEIQQKFSLHYINKIKWAPNIFKSKSFPFSTLKALQILKTFDCFIYVTNGSYFFSSAKKNFVFCMIPDKNLYQISPINRLKNHNFHFVANSFFTNRWLNKWGIHNTILHPYIENEFLENKEQKKENIILSVGRFFSHLHAKQHEKMTAAFDALQKKDKRFKSYSLLLAGGLKSEDQPYFNSISKLAEKNRSIILESNISYQTLINYYKKAKIYWHFTGFGVDETQHPEMVEHFGIAPLQAMAAGSVTFCYDAGGPKEFIKNGQNGFLFRTEKELLKKTIAIIDDLPMQKEIKQNGINTVKKNFSYAVFEKKVENIFL